MLLYIGIGIATLVAIVLLLALTKPKTFHIARSLDMRAPAAKVFPLIADFRSWTKWSPWEEIDPAMKRTYEGTQGTVGGAYGWEGNGSVGKGKMTILELDSPRKLSIALDFFVPFKAHHRTAFALDDTGGGTKVTWSMSGENNFMARVMCVFMNMDKMVGTKYSEGLAKLKKLAEA